jgi:Zn-dependent peptidase ImmA (M78 family)
MTATELNAYDGVVSIQTEAKKDAEAILRTVWGGHRFPVDPVRIARALGITVLDSRLPDDVAGTIVKENGKGPLVLLNGADHSNRKRFTLAHELGHFVRRADEGTFEYVDRRDILSAQGTDPDEIYANAFAANLLMPESEILRLHRGERATDLELALRFGVSREAVGIRLANLGIKPN